MKLISLGLIVNPVAGIGGAAGHKGSDDQDLVRAAQADGYRSPVHRRVAVTLDALARHTQFRWYTAAGEMGEDDLRGAGIQAQVVYAPQQPSSAADTREAARRLASCCDLILFAGGDGTARDMVTALNGTQQAVLGIPSGVKMHSSVFALSPTAAAEAVAGLLSDDLTALRAREVRDIDEAALRREQVISRYFGELWLPDVHRFVQQVKSSGREVEALVLNDIASFVTETMEDDVCYLIGPGSTTRPIMEMLGLPCTLLGFDAVRDRSLVAADVDELGILRLLDEGEVRAVITFIAGQGFLLGRGNQQLSASVVRRLGADNLQVISTRSKLLELGGRPLLLDSGDEVLDRQLSGMMPVLTGYDDYLLYPVSASLL